MSIHELREVIEKPAELPDVRLTFEGDLVGDLLFEVQGQVGALPLLQFTLNQLFQRRSGSQLTLSAYRELGGVKGALSKQAEETYSALLSDDHRKLACALFVRLIDPGASDQDTTRRRAALSEFSLADASQTRMLQEVSDAFIAARLLTTNEIAGMTTIEVSHEALIREWPRLAGWLRETREDIRLQQNISKDAAEWEQRDKPGDRLYRGSQLKEAQAWARRNTPSGSEVVFLRAGAARRMRSVASVTVIVLLLLSTTGVISWLLPRILFDPSYVNTLNEAGPGSLRYAVDASPAGSTIRFDVSLRGTIKLTSGDLIIERNLNIHGPGAGILSISGGKSGHIVRVIRGVSVTISGFTFKDSNTSIGLIDNQGILTLSNSVVSGNTGGGINNTGTLTVSNSTISGNTGLGINNSNNIVIGGTLIVSNSTISGNAGGIDNSNNSTLKVSNSTISGNASEGIASFDGGSLTVSNSTISGNFAGGPFNEGGGIYIASDVYGSQTLIEHVDLTFNTIYGNTTHGGYDIAIEDSVYPLIGNGRGIEQISQVKISNSIVAGDPAHRGPNILGMLTSYGYNLFQDNSGATFDPATRTQHGTDKTVSVNDLITLFADPVGLRDNGGPTKTYALAHKSPAVDQIPIAACHSIVPINNFLGTPIGQYTITTDQRGMKRPDDDESACDIGAYEYVDVQT
jgi:hypothetical protein